MVAPGVRTVIENSLVQLVESPKTRSRVSPAGRVTVQDLEAYPLTMLQSVVVREGPLSDHV